MAQETPTIQDAIARMHHDLGHMTHYDLMGLTPGEFDPARLRTSYRQLAKQWHIDRYNAVDLTAQERHKLQAIFAAVNNAHRVLSDEALRREYDAQLAAPAQAEGEGEGANMASLLNADSVYLRGRNMLQQGRHSGAKELFDEALSYNPDDQNIRLHALYAEYLMMPKDPGGKVTAEALARTQQIYALFNEQTREMEDIDWLFAFMGHIQMGLGNKTKANRLFRETLLINPKNKEATRYMRLLQMQQERESKKGLLEKVRAMFGK